MFAVDDFVMYGKTGVCKIIDIRKEKFGTLDEQMYYILEPVYSNNSTIYTPIDKNLDKFRRILSDTQVNELIKVMPDQKTIWIENEHERRSKYGEILKEGNPLDLVRLIKTMYKRRREQTENGRKFHMADDRIMKEAEKILYEEFAYALSIEPEEVLPFIMGEMNVTAKNKES